MGTSQVRWFTLTGSLTGFATGFMPLVLDWDYPMVVGGKTAGIYHTGKRYFHVRAFRSFRGDCNYL